MIGHVPKLIRRQAKQRSRNWLLESLPKNGIGLEIGVHIGDFSRIVLDATHPRKLHLIDPWKYQPDELYGDALFGDRGAGNQDVMDKRLESVQQRFRSEINEGRVVIHRGFSDELAASFPDDYFDWVYVDGNHLREYVRKDLELYSPKLKDGGIIAGDDYDLPGWWENGVKHAVDEFVAEGRAELVGIRRDQFVLRKPKQHGTVT